MSTRSGAGGLCGRATAHSPAEKPRSARSSLTNGGGGSGYRRHREVDPTYAATRDVFQLFYLFAMSLFLYDPHHRDPVKQEREVQRYARAIIERATLS